MELTRSVVEVASWRLASALVRRQPHLTLYEKHPAGGTYDVLCLRSDAGAEIMLNRAGTIQIHGREDGQPTRKEPIEWSEYLCAHSGMAFTERIESEAALPEAMLRPMTREAMVYKVIAALASLGMLGEPFEITQGFFDSSGQSDSSDAYWWEEIKTLAPDLTTPLPTDYQGRAGCRFWRVERSDFQLTFETSTGAVWPELEGDVDDIADDVAELGKYHYDLVDWASIQGWVYDGDAPTSGDWSRAPIPWPSAWTSSPGQDPDHEFDPMLRLMRASLELGQR